jgi:hypothetical protein
VAALLGPGEKRVLLEWATVMRMVMERERGSG